MGYDITFVPPGLDTSRLTPTVVFFFPDVEAARAAERDADQRFGNVLLVFGADPSAEQVDFITGCL